MSSIASEFNMLFTVRRVTRTQDVIGGSADSWADNSTGNGGRMRLLSAAERLMIAREGTTATHRLYCLGDVDVTTKDRIERESDNQEFDVTYVNDVDEAGEHLQIDMVERK